MNNEKKYLLGLTLAELKQVAKDLGMPAFTGGQIAKWLYVQHVKSIDEMTNLSKANRAKLAAEYEIGCAGYTDAQHSVDGTIKYLFPTRSGKFVETVYIPDKDRATLCVSSQVGCKMNCLFCQTGKQGFEGSLPAGDILNQIYSLPEVENLTNIVFMGQGEPMDNLDNVLRATEILTADYGWAWSPKRITVSSVGIKNKLKRFLEESECHVAISLHDPIPSERAELMPAEKGMGIEQVVELLRNYDFSHQRRLSFEYIVFTGGQIAKWLYVQHVKSIDEMTNLSKANRAKLAAEYEIGCAGYTDAQHSVDGTIKYLFPTRSGKFVETVYIPDKDRATLCVSSQVGCKMNCLFCQTGKQGFEGSLPAGDILNQIYSLPEVENLTNIVFMGQGEPMDNLDNVLRATEILTADYGWAWSPKRITVSSVGIKNKLKRFLEESECHVAISLHDPIPSERAELMPAEKGMGIEQVVELLRNYDFSHQRRLSFEYIVFKGVNDSMQHAKAIIKLLKGLDCRINLIRFHQIPDIPLHGVDDEKMEQFRDFLTSHGVFTTIRASRGQDIYAACGLLSTSKKIGEIRHIEES